MDIIYREALASDAEALLTHIHTVGGETDFLTYGNDSFNISPEREARFITRFLSSERDIMLVALDGDRVVGNAIIEHNRIPRLAHRAELSVTVLRDYWGRGIGTRLIEMLIDFSCTAGHDVITLTVRADNERAISLYKKLGFTLVGEMKNYFKISGVSYNAFLMEKYLGQHII